MVIRYTEIPRHRTYFWAPKFSAEIENSILAKVLSVETIVSDFCGETNYKVYYRTTGGRYWKVFTDFSPAFKVNGKAGHSTRETWFSLRRRMHVAPMLAALSSNIFWWWYTNSSNCRDLNPIDIRSFRINEEALQDPDLNWLGVEYLEDLQKNSIMEVTRRPTGRTETQTFAIQKSKPIIDRIDRVLAKSYRFTDDELDFLRNYDIEFRMGRNWGDREELD